MSTLLVPPSQRSRASRSSAPKSRRSGAAAKSAAKAPSAPRRKTKSTSPAAKASKRGVRGGSKPGGKSGAPARAKSSAAKRTGASRGSAPGFIYFFGQSRCDGRGDMKSLLGGKGANLAAMTSIGLPVPPGFTITTEVCNLYYAQGRHMPKALMPELLRAIATLEKETGKRFGDLRNPLLVSVRSGARDSMPGMMDTILNLGLNDHTVEALAHATGNPRFAWDSYRRFVQMYGDVVMGVQKVHENDHEPFEEVMDGLKREVGAVHDTELTTEHLKELVHRYRALIERRTGHHFPTKPLDQLMGAIGAVFSSWMNPRAIVYRQKYRIPAEWGTAVNVQSMVFGNMGDDSGTGVAFTRDPATGENVFYGEYLVNAQGEDVVAGVRTPKPVAEMAHDPQIGRAFKELERVRRTLEKNFGDVQDFEFTIEKKKLYMLQTRNGKRTARAYVRIAHDMVREGLMTPEHAIRSADPEAMNQLLQPIFDTGAHEAARREGRLLSRGLPAGPGAATGEIAFTAERAERLAREGRHVILCRIETSPEDLRGMIAADGILTTRGGVSSHAALVARQMGKVCVAGAGEIVIDYHAGTLICRGLTLREGDAISVDGTTGEVFTGRMATADSELKQVLVSKTLDPAKSEVFRWFDFVMKLADRFRRLGIRTNADTPEQVHHAIAFGAEGIGLCRTEHMFFEGDRIDAMREMILASSDAGRHSALSKLLPYQRTDFEGIFRALDGRPACIRLLDPPLHEFLPHDLEAQQELAVKLGVPVDVISRRVEELHEFNPMLGFRGCRLGVVHSEISRMQARAIFEAAAAVRREGIAVRPEVMVPLVGFRRELELQVEVIRSVAQQVMEESGVRFEYQVGTMIEIPRGAITADDIARSADFFSFGTNDLTQTALGMSRDDSGSFLPRYAELEIVKDNPFATIDAEGVGQLVRIACEKGRATRPDIKLGICGEHGGDPASIRFFEQVGLAYVSCSPFRVPVARLAAAKWAIDLGTTPSRSPAGRSSAGKSKSGGRGSRAARGPRRTKARGGSKSRR
ncbi:MAG: pyruvate, phosphate dikinase [Phycisphaeraceae bacterium]|nr:pyruvate, phosphate dikinase [Phycisphaeraceae bacterium]